MTPREKAEELIENYRNAYPTYTSNRLNLHQAKRCALIAVDEIIRELTEEISPSVHGFRHQYWIEVEQELEKI